MIIYQSYCLSIASLFKQQLTTIVTGISVNLNDRTHHPKLCALNVHTFVLTSFRPSREKPIGPKYLFLLLSFNHTLLYFPLLSNNLIRYY